MRAAVLGSPIAHSLSPAMHRAAYAQAGLEWTYEAIDVPAGGLAALVSGLADDWRGLSVTAPLKSEAAAFATERTAVVERLGVANTLVRTDNGWAADNTDVPGAIAALAEAGVTEVGSVRILGGGATAVAMAYALAAAGATSIEVVLRDPAKAGDVVAVGVAQGASVPVRRLDEPVRESTDLLISTVPVAAVELRASEWVNASAAIFDVIYDPWPTALAKIAHAQAKPVISGLDLLAHQAVLQLDQIAHIGISAELLRAAALAQLDRSA